MKFKIVRYRIVKDNYLGYECQVWKWYWPFWVMLGGINTNVSRRQARQYIRLYTK